jgi:hypothetical protein
MSAILQKPYGAELILPMMHFSARTMSFKSIRIYDEITKIITLLIIIFEISYSLQRLKKINIPIYAVK